MTAWEITAHQESIIVAAGGPDPATGKYAGFITHGHERNCRLLVSTTPVYDTAEAAEEAMRTVVADLVAWAENDQKTAETRKFLDSPDVKVAAEIATAVKGEGN